MISKCGIIKSISPNKFYRLQNKYGAILGEMFYTPPKSFKSEVALEAFMYNDFLYAKIKCRKQPENRLKTVCVRIDRSLGYDEYLSMFVAFPEYKQRGEFDEYPEI